MTETYQLDDVHCAPSGCGCERGCSSPASGPAEYGLGRELLKLLPGAVFFLAGLVVEHLIISTDLAWLDIGLYFIAYFLVGWNVLAMGVRSLFTQGLMDEFVLMSLATIGALAIGAYAEAVAVMLFYRTGELFQDRAVRSSRQSVAALLELRPDTARVVDKDQVFVLDPAQVQVGQVIQVNPGERVPLDGTVQSGQSQADTSALTGESRPRRLAPGDSILSGMVNLSGVLTVRVDKPLAQSTVSVILDLVQNAAQRKAPTEQFMTRVARVYTPVVVGLAAMIAFGPVLAARLPGLENQFAVQPQLADWVYRGLVFLVISCPCALVISIPLAFFAGLGACSRQGILIKGANFLEALNRLRAVVWDKTGTLTQGRFAVQGVYPEQGFSREDVLTLAAAAEQHSSHPIARAIVREAAVRDQKTEDRSQRSEVRGQNTEKTRGERYWDDGNFELGRSLRSESSDGKDSGVEVREFSGQGVQTLVSGREVLVGTEDFLRSQGVARLDRNITSGGVWVSVDKKPAGRIVVQDELRYQSQEAVAGLRRLGVRAQYMLTGDSQEAAAEIGSSLNLDGVEAGLLPQDKVAKLELIMSRNTGQGYTAFVGDGINDAPVLARSDIGVAMGGLGSDAAIEAADVVLMEDDPGKLVQAVSLAARTRSIVWQNIGLALGVKGVVMSLGALGLASMWAAVFADVGVALLAVGNSLRILR
ncbi:MAG: heavy metal translocating P-type ATPase [Desulfovermiculus sp.]